MNNHGGNGRSGELTGEVLTLTRFLSIDGHDANLQ